MGKEVPSITRWASVRASAVAALEGWALASLVSLPAVLRALWLDRPPQGIAPLMAQGAGVWFLFTAALGFAGWLLLALPLGLLLRPATLVRFRWTIAGGASLVAVALIATEVGLTSELANAHKPGSHEASGAWKNRLFWNTALWAITYAVTTTLRFARSLRRDGSHG